MTQLSTPESIVQRFLHVPGSLESMPQLPESELPEFAENIGFAWQQAGEISLNRYWQIDNGDLTQMHRLGSRVGPRVTWEIANPKRRTGGYRQLGGVAIFEPLEPEELVFRREFMRSPTSSGVIAEYDQAQLSRFLTLCQELGYVPRSAISLINEARIGALSIRGLVRQIGKDGPAEARAGKLVGPNVFQHTASREIRQRRGLALYEKILPVERKEATATSWINQS